MPIYVSVACIHIVVASGEKRVLNINISIRSSIQSLHHRKWGFNEAATCRSPSSHALPPTPTTNVSKVDLLWVSRSANVLVPTTSAKIIALGKRKEPTTSQYRLRYAFELTHLNPLAHPFDKFDFSASRFAYQSLQSQHDSLYIIRTSFTQHIYCMHRSEETHSFFRERHRDLFVLSVNPFEKEKGSLRFGREWWGRKRSTIEGAKARHHHCLLRQCACAHVQPTSAMCWFAHMTRSRGRLAFDIHSDATTTALALDFKLFSLCGASCFLASFRSLRNVSVCNAATLLSLNLRADFTNLCTIRTGERVTAIDPETYTLDNVSAITNQLSILFLLV